MWVFWFFWLFFFWVGFLLPTLTLSDYRGTSITNLSDDRGTSIKVSPIQETLASLLGQFLQDPLHADKAVVVAFQQEARPDVRRGKLDHIDHLKKWREN
jgi:hypothetical protein